jgi:hypothetical protein
MAKQNELSQAEIDAIVARVEKINLPCVGWFKSTVKTFGGWQKSTMGPPATDTQMKLGHLIYLAKRLGVELAYVIMLVRENGCTDAEHAAAFHCRTAHNNAFGTATPSMVTMGVATREVVGGVKPYRNKLVITAKGWRIVEAELTKLEGSTNAAMPAKAPSKAKGAVKPVKATKVARKAKNAPAVTAVAPEANAVIEPVQAEPVTVERPTDEQLAALASQFNS